MRLLFLFLLLPPFFSTAQVAEIESVSVEFLFVEKDVDGTIAGIEEQSQINLTDFTKSTLKGSAVVETLDTGNFLRDGHLMWEKYFNEDDYPLLKFRSKSITKTGSNTFNIQTDLTIKGITKTAEATAQIVEDTITITATIYTSDWDINIKKDRNENELELSVIIKIDK